MNRSLPTISRAGCIGLGAALALLASGTAANAQGACSAGSYSVVYAPDNSALSVLFDDFVASATPSDPASAQRSCDLQIPLHLPEGFSLGVYRVDYRGYANLAPKQDATLTVVHHLGSDKKGHRFNRRVKGPEDGEFTFTENIGAGLMKRAGCGEQAVLNVSVSLSLDRSDTGEALAALDSTDGAAKGGLVYHLDLKKC